ncbi:hypothetical protein AN396_11680 [Candidatus Epulonipiscium fishelsonii]|uniref:Uncharacterized protein n=1 Tax=Candidatus Epulonipiscium fishelsonii TaxID=77094 RepID=A0ACC8X8B6_9FIRM|nr:hypothetical protein AN396_11680 [Epulopiscium sp. SCG-B11WGA-EpuloA1]
MCVCVCVFDTCFSVNHQEGTLFSQNIFTALDMELIADRNSAGILSKGCIPAESLKAGKNT